MNGSSRLIPYSKARQYIEEGDILLFRGKGFISRLITKFSTNPYSHIGVATWRGEPTKSALEIVEMRELKGGRIVNLSTQVNKFDSRIDVYRVMSPQIVASVQFDEKNGLQISKKEIQYDGRLVTDTMREWAGLEYGYKRIWLLAKRKLPFLRWFTPPNMDDSQVDELDKVCSTAVASAIRANFVDFFHLRADSEIEPAHFGELSESIITYLFTLSL